MDSTNSTNRLKYSFLSPAGLISNYLTSFPNQGLFLAQEEPLELWQELELSFNLPGETGRIECRAEVLWRNDVEGELPKGVGVMFTGLTAEDRRRLDSYIRTYGRRDELLDGRMVRIFPMEEKGPRDEKSEAGAGTQEEAG